MIGILLGIYKMNNYWDFPIYLTVSFLTLLFLNIIIYKDIKDKILSTLTQMILIITISTIISIPFSISFSKMASIIKISPEHSPIYKLLVIWGLPLLLLLTYIISTFKNISKKKNIIINYFNNIKLTDLFTIILGLCAVGLIIIPELIYVQDIYTNDIRANTMFKLNYQSYIMFGICIGYFIIKLLTNNKKIYKKISIIILFFFTLSLGYSYEGTKEWFGNIYKPNNYKSLNVKYFLDNDIIYFYLPDSLKEKIYSSISVNTNDDLAVINWLNKNCNNTDTILEVNGESYTFYNRISTFTGHPTVLGWQTHEWLWRSDGKNLDYPEIMDKRAKDIEILYTSKNTELLSYLIKKYNIKYIIIINLERIYFNNEDKLLPNENELKQLGDVVFVTHKNNSKYPTYIIKIS